MYFRQDKFESVKNVQRILVPEFRIEFVRIRMKYRKNSHKFAKSAKFSNLGQYFCEFLPIFTKKCEFMRFTN